MVAPPGYGKTTLMAQWAERIGPRVAWVSCDDGDNDPVVLLSALAVALDRIEPIDPTIFWALASSGAGITAVPRFVSAIASMERPVTVLLDHAEAVTNKQCLDSDRRACPAPPARLAVRARLPQPACRCPAARLRAQGGIVEIGAEDLAMGPLEAALLLKGAGADVDEASIHDLLQRTEGWPAGLYIAALAMKSGTRQNEVGFTFTGDDIFMGDYLRSELLDRVSGAEASFLTRTSVLDRMCGPLCDAILGEKGSGRVLEQLESQEPAGGPARPPPRVVPLPPPAPGAAAGGTPAAGARAWSPISISGRPRGSRRTRCRRPRSSMPRRRETTTGWPAWCWNCQQPVWASGRVETVLRWMEWLSDVTAAEHFGAIAMHGSLIFALLGQPSEAERWAAAAERVSPAGILPDGSTMEGTLAYLRAILCRNGIDQMRRDAQMRLGRAEPVEPVPGDDAVHRGHFLPAAG